MGRTWKRNRTKQNTKSATSATPKKKLTSLNRRGRKPKNSPTQNS